MRLWQLFTCSGEAFIGNERLSRDRASYLQSIGYCPQFDSIIEVVIIMSCWLRSWSSSFCEFIIVMLGEVLMSCQGVDWQRDVDSLCADPRTAKLGEPDHHGAGEAGELRRPHPVPGPAVRPVQRRQQEETKCRPRSHRQVHLSNTKLIFVLVFHLLQTSAIC